MTWPLSRRAHYLFEGPHFFGAFKISYFHQEVLKVKKCGVKKESLRNDEQKIQDKDVNTAIIVLKFNLLW